MKDLFLVNTSFGEGEDNEASLILRSGPLFELFRQFESSKHDYGFTVWHINGFSEELTRMSLVSRNGKLVLVGGGMRFNEE